MKEIEALEELAHCVAVGGALTTTLKRLGFSLKNGKTFNDVLEAKQLKPGQTPGGYEIMVANVEKNLRDIVEFTG